MAIFNPFLPSFLDDPYRSYARLRSEDPVHHSLALQAWVLTAYDDCATVLSDHRVFSSDSSYARGDLAEALREQRRQGPLGDVAVVLNSEPPVHTRLRSILNHAITPRTVSDLRPRIEEIATALLAGVDEDEPLEVMGAFAQPLPLIVIAELLGLPPADRALFRGWSTAIASATALTTSPAELEAARGAARDLIDYLRPFVDQRRARPSDDLLSVLVRAETSEGAISPDELLAFCMLLLVAGNETTTNLIGNGVLALLAEPRQWALLRERPQLVPGAVEELLRFDSPVQALVRFATTDTTVGETRIAAGETLLAIVGAANRDPARFDDPDRLDVQRRECRHLSFGRGIHYCLGSPLARLEGEVAFNALLGRFPSPRLVAGGVARGGTFLLRGLSRLELEAA